MVQTWILTSNYLQDGTDHADRTVVVDDAPRRGRQRDYGVNGNDLEHVHRAVRQGPQYPM